MPDQRNPNLIGLTFRGFVELAREQGVEYEVYHFDNGVRQFRHWNLTKDTTAGYRFHSVRLDQLDQMMTREEFDFFCKHFEVVLELGAAEQWPTSDSSTVN